METRQTQCQTQKMAQFQIQYLSLLTMDQSALDAHLYSAYLENPFLEQVYRPRTLQPQEYSPLDALPAKETINRYKPFLEQLNLSAYTDAEIMLMRNMIDSLDVNGYYPYSPEETAALFNISADCAARCLKKLRSLEPAGVFARNLPHCLLLQLKRKKQLTQELHDLIVHHLADFSLTDDALSEKTGVPKARLKTYRKWIAALNPRPFYKPDCRRSRPMMPDVLCHWDENGWRIEDGAQTQYILSSEYGRILSSVPAADQLYLTEKARQAKDLLQALALRRQTLLRLCAFLLERQYASLRFGFAPCAVTMTQAAQALSLSVSTISRACRDKYIQCPCGVIPIRSLFCAPADRENGLSDAQIKHRLRLLIKQEDPAHPLSDDRLAKLLISYGIQLSRRTVAKYRSELHIPQSFQRKTPLA